MILEIFGCRQIMTNGFTPFEMKDVILNLSLYHGAQWVIIHCTVHGQLSTLNFGSPHTTMGLAFVGWCTALFWHCILSWVTGFIVGSALPRMTDHSILVVDTFR